MTLAAAVIDALIASGCSAEQLGAAVKAANAEDEARTAAKRAKATQRKRNQRSRDAMSHDVTRTERDIAGQSVTPFPSEVSPRTPFPTNPIPVPPSPPKGGSSPAGFDAFWADYPNKVGKAVASKAFQQARQRAPIETIMAGLARYVAKTDDRPWCNPATWLNQDRWDDQPAAAPQSRGQPPPRRANPVSDAWGFLERRDDNGPIDITPDAGAVRYLPARSG